jgi:hypothetical protein
VVFVVLKKRVKPLRTPRAPRKKKKKLCETFVLFVVKKHPIVLAKPYYLD